MAGVDQIYWPDSDVIRSGGVEKGMKRRDSETKRYV
jgi:hypothetical protein